MKNWWFVFRPAPPSLCGEAGGSENHNLARCSHSSRSATCRYRACGDLWAKSAVLEHFGPQRPSGQQRLRRSLSSLSILFFFWKTVPLKQQCNQLWYVFWPYYSHLMTNLKYTCKKHKKNDWLSFSYSSKKKHNVVLSLISCWKQNKQMKFFEIYLLLYIFLKSNGNTQLRIKSTGPAC